MWEILVDCCELASVMILETDPLTEGDHRLLHLHGEFCIFMFRHYDDKLLKLIAKSVSSACLKNFTNQHFPII